MPDGLEPEAPEPGEALGAVEGEPDGELGLDVVVSVDERGDDGEVAVGGEADGARSPG